MGRLVDYSVGQRIVVESTLHSGRATVWRFVRKAEENNRICIYRCSMCQADYNEVLSVFGIVLPTPPEIQVVENGRLLDNPDSAKHFCCWETNEANEIGIIHARRLIFLLAQDIEDGFTQAALSKKLKEIKRHPIFDQMDFAQKSKAMALINDVTRETISKLKEAGVDVMDDPPIYLPQPVVKQFSPKVSRLRHTLTFLSPQRSSSMTTVFREIFSPRN